MYSDLMCTVTLRILSEDYSIARLSSTSSKLYSPIHGASCLSSVSFVLHSETYITGGDCDWFSSHHDSQLSVSKSLTKLL